MASTENKGTNFKAFDAFVATWPEDEDKIDIWFKEKDKIITNFEQAVQNFNAKNYKLQKKKLNDALKDLPETDGKIANTLLGAGPQSLVNLEKINADQFKALRMMYALKNNLEGVKPRSSGGGEKATDIVKIAAEARTKAKEAITIAKEAKNKAAVVEANTKVTDVEAKKKAKEARKKAETAIQKAKEAEAAAAAAEAAAGETEGKDDADKAKNKADEAKNKAEEAEAAAKEAEAAAKEAEAAAAAAEAAAKEAEAAEAAAAEAAAAEAEAAEAEATEAEAAAEEARKKEEAAEAEAKEAKNAFDPKKLNSVSTKDHFTTAVDEVNKLLKLAYPGDANKQLKKIQDGTISTKYDLLYKQITENLSEIDGIPKKVKTGGAKDVSVLLKTVAGFCFKKMYENLKKESDQEIYAITQMVQKIAARDKDISKDGLEDMTKRVTILKDISNKHIQLFDKVEEFKKKIKEKKYPGPSEPSEPSGTSSSESKDTEVSKLKGQLIQEQQKVNDLEKTILKLKQKLKDAEDAKNIAEEATKKAEDAKTEALKAKSQADKEKQDLVDSLKSAKDASKKVEGKKKIEDKIDALSNGLFSQISKIKSDLASLTASTASVDVDQIKEAFEEVLYHKNQNVSNWEKYFDSIRGNLKVSPSIKDLSGETTWKPGERKKDSETDIEFTWGDVIRYGISPYASRASKTAKVLDMIRAYDDPNSADQALRAFAKARAIAQESNDKILTGIMDTETASTSKLHKTTLKKTYTDTFASLV